MEQLSLPLEPAPELKSIEDWGRAKQTELHWFHAAKFANRWGAGRMISESDYDAAIAAVQKIVLR